MNSEVNVGIRPEDLFTTDGEPVYSGKVDITEALGEITLLYFENTGSEKDGVIAKLNGIHSGLNGTTVNLAADPSKVLIFADGKSLNYIQ